MTNKDRNSIGLIEDLESAVYNLEAINDHLMDLDDDELTDALNLIPEISVLRQELIAVYAKAEDINYKYHCAYKHALKSYGLLKESIQIAKRQGHNSQAIDLVNILKAFIPLFVKIKLRYLNMQELEDQEVANCMRCLNDLIFSKLNKQVMLIGGDNHVYVNEDTKLQITNVQVQDPVTGEWNPKDTSNIRDVVDVINNS